MVYFDLKLRVIDISDFIGQKKCLAIGLQVCVFGKEIIVSTSHRLQERVVKTEPLQSRHDNDTPSWV